MTRSRIWFGLVMPALAVALAFVCANVLNRETQADLNDSAPDSYIEDITDAVNGSSNSEDLSIRREGVGNYFRAAGLSVDDAADLKVAVVNATDSPMVFRFSASPRVAGIFLDRKGFKRIFSGGEYPGSFGEYDPMFQAIPSNWRPPTGAAARGMEYFKGQMGYGFGLIPGSESVFYIHDKASGEIWVMGF